MVGCDQAGTRLLELPEGIAVALVKLQESMVGTLIGPPKDDAESVNGETGISTVLVVYGVIEMEEVDITHEALIGLLGHGATVVVYGQIVAVERTLDNVINIRFI
jgi:hypothetical protein